MLEAEMSFAVRVHSGVCFTFRLRSNICSDRYRPRIRNVESVIGRNRMTYNCIGRVHCIAARSRRDYLSGDRSYSSGDCDHRTLLKRNVVGSHLFIWLRQHVVIV